MIKAIILAPWFGLQGDFGHNKDNRCSYSKLTGLLVYFILFFFYMGAGVWTLSKHFTNWTNSWYPHILTWPFIPRLFRQFKMWVLLPFISRTAFRHEASWKSRIWFRFNSKNQYLPFSTSFLHKETSHTFQVSGKFHSGVTGTSNREYISDGRDNR